MNQLGRGRLSSLLMLATVVWSICLPSSEQVLAQSSQSNCMVTTRGGPDVLDVVFLMECSSAESVGVLHFEVTPVTGASSSDREIEVVFNLSPSSDGRFATTHRQSIVLKEGAASAQGAMPFVMNSSTDTAQQRMLFWNVRVLEDGRDIESSRKMQANQGGQYVPIKLNPGEPPPYFLHQRGTQGGAILHVLDKGQKFDSGLAYRLSSGIMKGPQNQPILDEPTFDLSRDFTRGTNVRNVASLPEYWHYYLQFNAVTIAPEALGKLLTERPLAAEALKQYVASGGDLIVVTRKVDAPRLLDQWVMNKQDAHDPSLWLTDQNSLKSNQAVLDEISGNTDSQAPSSAPKAEEKEPTPEKAAQERSATKVTYQRYAIRSYVRGRFICFENLTSSATPASMFSNTPTSIGLAISSIHDESWSLRNMIAAVGKPPVWMFCGIILLFGLILGPGLLILTAWIGRRSLLILLVPLVSIGATLAIVAYQVLHEGFGTHVRISSVMNIDERTGDGFVWSRQNFFSGWPPREGMSIPNSVYCRPVGNSRFGRSGMPRTSSVHQYTVEHKPELSIWRGVIQAREQKQLLIGHPAKLSMPIQVKRIDDKRALLSNLTNETLPFVVLRDGEFGYYFAENVAPKTQVEVASVPFGDIAGALSRLRSELAPALPPELRSMGWGVSQDQSGAEVLDQAWVGSMAEQSTVSTIKPYGFVTLIRNCSDIYIPLKANTSEALHLVTGSALW